MIVQPLVYASVLFLAVIVISIIFRKQFLIPYDKKLLISNLIAFVVTLLSVSIFGLDFQEKSEWSLAQGLLACTVIILFVYAVLQFISWLIMNVCQLMQISRVPRFVFDIASFFIIIILVFVCTKYILNQELTGLVITSTVFSAVIGLALQGTLSNLFSGLSLQIAAPFKMNDWVKIGGHEGKVVSQNWRSVTLLTRESHRISLTNRFVSEDSIVNYSKPSRRELNNFYITLDYGHPPNVVKQIMRDLIEEIEDIDLDPINGPMVVDYMDSGVKYCLKYWIKDYQDVLRIEDEVLTRLWYRLKREHIKIPYPTQELQMQVVTPPEGNGIHLPHKKIYNFLEKQAWLNSMDPEKVDELAGRCHQILFAKDDMIVRQNDEGDSMFIIVSGSVTVLLDNDTDKLLKIAEKHQGDFFGEMSLLTGEKRTASIQAKTDCLVLVIDKLSFQKLLYADKQLLDQFIDGLENNKSGLQNAIAAEQSKSTVTRETARERFISQIKDYLLID